eukprot:TRINITY_DN56011_c0_g1_i1.p1 TRINITY_DN56011_c0_g1~~TRINITY_DN56011_c0_g1_i1.p1  ORF type:complete len:243 (-),score=36.06 TRINITY_DN56011_c0_g1_i1:132-860(-)
MAFLAVALCWGSLLLRVIFFSSQCSNVVIAGQAPTAVVAAAVAAPAAVTVTTVTHVVAGASIAATTEVGDSNVSVPLVVGAPVLETETFAVAPRLPRQLRLLRRGTEVRKATSADISRIGVVRRLELEPVFCLRPGGPACTAPPCCCWSTFAALKHPTYPNPDQMKHRQRCLNPPVGYEYTTSDVAAFEALKGQNAPRLEGRQLCCLASRKDPKYFSMRKVPMGVPIYRREASNPSMEENAR